MLRELQVLTGGNMGFNDVENPKHYQLEGVEPYQSIDFIKAILGRDGFADYCRGSALKYLVRAGKKDKEKVKEDLEKARVFISWAIEMLGTFEGEM